MIATGLVGEVLELRQVLRAVESGAAAVGRLVHVVVVEEVDALLELERVRCPPRPDNRVVLACPPNHSDLRRALTKDRRGLGTGGRQKELQNGLAVLDAEALVEVGVERGLREVLHGGRPVASRPDHAHEVRDDRRCRQRFQGMEAGLLDVRRAESFKDRRRSQVSSVCASLQDSPVAGDPH